MSAPKWLEALKVLGPMVLSLIPGIPPAVIPAIISGIREAEALNGASNEDKKAHALNIVDLTVGVVNETKGHEAINVNNLNTAISSGIDMVVSSIKVFKNSSLPIVDASKQNL